MGNLLEISEKIVYLINSITIECTQNCLVSNDYTFHTLIIYLKYSVNTINTDSSQPFNNASTHFSTIQKHLPPRIVNSVVFILYVHLPELEIIITVIIMNTTK